jgi:hypothetical protein
MPRRALSFLPAVLAAPLVLAFLSTAAEAQERRLDLEAHAGVLFGAVPGLSKGSAIGFTWGLGSVQGPVKIGGDAFVAVGGGYEQGSHSALFGGLLGTCGLAAPKNSVVPIVNFHFGGLIFSHGGTSPDPSVPTTDFNLVAGSTLGLAFPVSKNAAMHIAAKGFYPLFPSSNLPKAGALGRDDGPSRRVFPLFAELGFDVL